MTASPYGGEDQPTRLEALADHTPHMDPADVTRMLARYTATNMGHLFRPPIRPGDCYCSHRIEHHDDEDGLCTLCGCDLYVEHADILATRNELDRDTEFDGERHPTNNTQAAVELERRRARRTA